MSIDKAIEDVAYLQWGLQTGGINHHYAKNRINEIMSKFNQKDREIIKQNVTERLSE